MFTLLVAITPDEIRRIGIPLGIIIGSILGGLAIMRIGKRRPTVPQKGMCLGSR